MGPWCFCKQGDTSNMWKGTYCQSIHYNTPATTCSMGFINFIYYNVLGHIKYITCRKLCILLSFCKAFHHGPLQRESFKYQNIVAAFRGMQVSPAKHSYGLSRKCDYHSVTTGQTDAGQSDPYVSLCFAGDTKMCESGSSFWHDSHNIYLLSVPCA